MTDKNKFEIEIIAKTDKASKEFRSFEKDTNKHLSGIGKGVNGLKQGFLGLGTAIKGAFVAGAAAITAAVYTAQRIVRDAISAASALEEVQNKFNVVFAKQIEEAEKWADALRESYLMSRREAKEYLATMQDLLVPMGMASDEAGKLSFEIVKLAADLGSFNNLPTKQVMTDIQSALVGNYETMKKYGVVLNAARVEQAALNAHLASSKDKLTAAHRAQAAYNIIVNDSAAAIGDVARSQDSYANQVKKYKANLEDLRVILGNSLLPVATDVVSKINDWVKANEAMIQQKVPEYVERIGTAAEKAGGALSKIVPAIAKLGGVLFETKEEGLVRQIDNYERLLQQAEQAQEKPNIFKRLFGNPEKEAQYIQELKNKLDQLYQAYWTHEEEVAKKIEDTKKKQEEQNEEIKKGGEAAEGTGETLDYILDGVKHTVGQAKEAAGHFSKIKTASEEAETSFKERSEELEKQNKILIEQIELLKKAAIAAKLSEGGIKSYAPGMKYGGPVLNRQGGGPIPGGWGGGDKVHIMGEPGEEMLDKVTARYARERGILDALRKAAHGGGMGQERGYFRVDFGFPTANIQNVQITADEAGKALMEYIKHGQKTKGIF
jgi:hypothetical protein